jgi:tetratricopeptide (TPR) repeat protein
MKMKKQLLALIALVFSLTIAAQPTDFDQANALYKAGNYSSAIESYEKISSTQGVSPELFYNLGNAYYKENEIAKAILNYERALRIAPNYDDARNNLEFAQTKVVDNIVQIPPFFLKKWNAQLVQLLRVDQWYVVSLLIFILTLSLALFFIFGNSLALRKIAFYAAFVGFAFTLTTLWFAVSQWNKITKHSEAIIMSSSITVKSSPDKSGTDLFQLHEGTKVTIHSTLDQWVEVKVGNGSIGWIENKHIEKI